MPELAQSANTLRLYFTTLKVAGGIHNSELGFGIFDQRDFCDQFIKTLICHIERQHLEVYGFVILSNQIHLILSSSENISHELDVLKMTSAKELIIQVGKRINSLDDAASREEKGLRRFFNRFINSKESSFWQSSEKPIKLKIKNHEKNLEPITSYELVAHLTDPKRNYLQLGATAFTKLMLDTMKI